MNRELVAIVSAQCPSPLLRIEDERFYWLDIVACAEFLGLLAPLAEEIRAGLAARAAAEAADLAPAAAAIQDRANRWRYSLNLITADETRLWLAARNLSLDDLHDTLSRHYWQEHRPAAAATLRAVPEAEVWARLWADVHFTHRFRPFARALVHRAIASLLILNRTTVDDILSQNVLAAFRERHGLTPAPLAELAGRLRFQGEHLPDLLQMEARYLRHRGELATPEQCQRRLRALRPRLLRVRFGRGVFASAHQAREAQLCVNVDGEPLAAVCTRAGAGFGEASGYLEDLGSAGALLVSAQPGECLAPFEEEGRFVLLHLWEKDEPEPGCPEVQRRVEEAIVGEAFAQYEQADVLWLQFAPE